MRVADSKEIWTGSFLKQILFLPFLIFTARHWCVGSTLHNSVERHWCSGSTQINTIENYWHLGNILSKYDSTLQIVTARHWCSDTTLSFAILFIPIICIISPGTQISLCHKIFFVHTFASCLGYFTSDAALFPYLSSSPSDVNSLIFHNILLAFHFFFLPQILMFRLYRGWWDPRAE